MRQVLQVGYVPLMLSGFDGLAIRIVTTLTCVASIATSPGAPQILGPSCQARVSPHLRGVLRS